MFNLFVRIMESMAAVGGCSVNTAYEFTVASIWHYTATQYASVLSACAQAFFGV